MENEETLSIEDKEEIIAISTEGRISMPKMENKEILSIKNKDEESVIKENIVTEKNKQESYPHFKIPKRRRFIRNATSTPIPTKIFTKPIIKFNSINIFEYLDIEPMTVDEEEPIKLIQKEEPIKQTQKSKKSSRPTDKSSRPTDKSSKPNNKKRKSTEEIISMSTVESISIPKMENEKFLSIEDKEEIISMPTEESVSMQKMENENIFPITEEKYSITKINNTNNVEEIPAENLENSGDSETLKDENNEDDKTVQGECIWLQDVDLHQYKTRKFTSFENMEY